MRISSSLRVSVLCVFVWARFWTQAIAGDAVFTIAPASVSVVTNWEFSSSIRLQVPDGNPGAFQVVLVYDPNSLRILNVQADPQTPFRGNLYADTSAFMKGYTRIAAVQTDRASDAVDELVFSVQWLAIGQAGQTSDVSVYVESIIDFNWRYTSVSNVPMAVCVAGADSNGNGIPDFWEIERYGSPTNLASTSDGDDDGFTLEQEYAANTDPRDPDSFPMINVASVGTNIAVFCGGSRSRRYHFDVRQSMPEGSWSNWYSVLPEGDGLVWLVDQATTSNRFYRFRVELPVSTSGAGSETNAHWTSDALSDFTALQPGLFRLNPGNVYSLTALDWISSNAFAFCFNLANGSPAANTDWAGSMLSFGGTPFDASANGIVLNLSAEGTTEVKLEATDTGDRKAVVVLTGLRQQERRYKVTAAELLVAGGVSFDPAHVKGIALVVDGTVAGWSRAYGKVHIGTKGIPSDRMGVLTGTAYNESLLTSLSNFYPIAESGGGNTSTGRPNGVLVMTPLPQEKGFKYDYNLWDNDTSFTYVKVSPGFWLNGEFQGYPMDLSSGYTLAAKGTTGARVGVSFRDVNGFRGGVVLQLKEHFSNYNIDFDAAYTPPNFLRASVAEITFVEDWTVGTPQLSDSVQIETPGLYY